MIIFDDYSDACDVWFQRNQAVLESELRLVALAAATPCTVLYAEIGRQLSTRPETQDPGHPFRAWLDLYADPTVQDMAQAWSRTLNQWAQVAPSEQLSPARTAFAQSTRCETAFWQQAWLNSGR